MWCHIYIPLGINPNFFGLSLCERQIVYALRTRTPVEARKLLPRLACVRPAASVHPEPGSNSSSLKSLISSNRFLSYWLQVSLDSLNLILCCTTLCQCTCCFFLQEHLSSHLRVQRYGVFLILQIFWQLFLKFFWGKWLSGWKSEVRESKFFHIFLERKIERNYWRLKVAKKAAPFCRSSFYYLLFFAIKPLLGQP